MTKKLWMFASVEPNSESSLFSWVLEQCAEKGLSLMVVVVLPKLGHQILDFFEHEKHQNLMQKQVVLENKKRENWLKMAEDAGVEFSLDVRFGKLFYEVIQAAHQNQVELLIKQAEDIVQTEGVLFHSGDWHLLRKSPVPLLLYRSGAALPFEKAMVSIDVDVETVPYKVSELNQKLLFWAQRLQKNKTVNVVHAWQADVENLVRHWDTDLESEALIGINERLYYEHKKAVNDELASSSIEQQQSKIFMCRGEPAESIAQSVDEQSADLIVLGTLARTGIPGLLIGNTAEDVLERVNCSVLTIKPANFKSPII